MHAVRLKTPPTVTPSYWGRPDKIALLIPAPFRALELTGILQTTLDVEELLDLFLQEVKNCVAVDGLRYRNSDAHLELLRGSVSYPAFNRELTVRGQRLGELSLSLVRPFQADELEALDELLVALLYPLRNALDYRRALHCALSDTLTGANNRAALDPMLQREIELAWRRNTPLSVALLDIDFFKQINDNYGHPVGDLCLQALAQCVQANIRGGDLLFRVGGEEFLVLMSQTDLDGAEQLAERIRRAVEALTLHVLREHRLTISLGVTQLVLDDSLHSLYERADQALYQAKRTGRNRVASVRGLAAISLS